MISLGKQIWQNDQTQYRTSNFFKGIFKHVKNFTVTFFQNTNRGQYHDYMGFFKWLAQARQRVRVLEQAL